MNVQGLVFPVAAKAWKFEHEKINFSDWPDWVHEAIRQARCRIVAPLTQFCMIEVCCNRGNHRATQGDWLLCFPNGNIRVFTDTEVKMYFIAAQ